MLCRMEHEGRHKTELCLARGAAAVPTIAAPFLERAGPAADVDSCCIICSRTALTYSDPQKWRLAVALWKKLSFASVYPSSSTSIILNVSWCVPPLQRGQEPEEPEPRWGLFDLEAYQKPWAVPWGPRTVVSGMTLWATSFIIVGVVLLPLIGYTFGIKVPKPKQEFF